MVHWGIGESSEQCGKIILTIQFQLLKRTLQQDLVRKTEIGVGLGLQNIERFSQRGQIFGPGGPSSGQSGRLPATFVASTSVQMTCLWMEATIMWCVVWCHSQKHLMCMWSSEMTWPYWDCWSWNLLIPKDNCLLFIFYPFKIILHHSASWCQCPLASQQLIPSAGPQHHCVFPFHPHPSLESPSLYAAHPRSDLGKPNLSSALHLPICSKKGMSIVLAALESSPGITTDKCCTFWTFSYL